MKKFERTLFHYFATEGLVLLVFKYYIIIISIHIV